MSQFPTRYDGRKCFMPCAPGPCHCRDSVRDHTVHTSGYLRTVDANVLVPTVPAGGLNLEDDTPLAGGACDLGGACESCQ